jgi:hypothetical protein
VLAATQNLDSRELVAKVRAVSTMRRDKGIQAVFRHACDGETGLFEDPSGNAYISGGFDTMMRAMMRKELLDKTATPEAASYFRKVDDLKRQAFDHCADHRPEVGQRLREVALDPPVFVPKTAQQPAVSASATSSFPALRTPPPVCLSDDPPEIPVPAKSRPVIHQQPGVH